MAVDTFSPFNWRHTIVWWYILTYHYACSTEETIQDVLLFLKRIDIKSVDHKSICHHNPPLLKAPREYIKIKVLLLKSSLNDLISVFQTDNCHKNVPTIILLTRNYVFNFFSQVWYFRLNSSPLYYMHSD